MEPKTNFRLFRCRLTSMHIVIVIAKSLIDLQVKITFLIGFLQLRNLQIGNITTSFQIIIINSFEALKQSTAAITLKFQELRVVTARNRICLAKTWNFWPSTFSEHNKFNCKISQSCSTDKTKWVACVCASFGLSVRVL